VELDKDNIEAKIKDRDSYPVNISINTFFHELPLELRDAIEKRYQECASLKK
jgi:hypothetical protein